jgi:hypothetical protein
MAVLWLWQFWILGEESLFLKEERSVGKLSIISSNDIFSIKNDWHLNIAIYILKPFTRKVHIRMLCI